MLGTKPRTSGRASLRPTFLFCFVFWSRSHVAQVGLKVNVSPELTLNVSFSCLHLLSAGIIGDYRHKPPQLFCVVLGTGSRILRVLGSKRPGELHSPAAVTV